MLVYAALTSITLFLPTFDDILTSIRYYRGVIHYTVHMRWSRQSYPDQFRTLSPQVRDKAIEIGNDLMSRGNDEMKVIPVAYEIAKDWIQYSAPAVERNVK